MTLILQHIRLKIRLYQPIYRTLTLEPMGMESSLWGSKEHCRIIVWSLECSHFKNCNQTDISKTRIQLILQLKPNCNPNWTTAHYYKLTSEAEKNQYCNKTATVENSPLKIKIENCWNMLIPMSLFAHLPTFT
jgi:hypothetical protein